MLPKINNYGEYSSGNYGAHTLHVDLGPLELWYSYETIVAFRDETGLQCSENQWSVTTGKHLGWIQPDKKSRVKAAEFNALLSAALERHIS